jgi:ribonuclease P protein component
VLDATASTPPRARVAYAVGGVGGAVARNRARRRLRAVVRAEAGRLASGAYLFGAGRDAVSAPFEVLEQSVRDLLDDALRAT